MARRKNKEENNNTNIMGDIASEVISEITETNSEPSQVEEITIEIGSKVKIRPDIPNDIMGRRIHNGIKNYVYTVLAVRTDKYCTIECLTYVFTLHQKDLILVK